ncbi:MAG: hypothetical protein RJB58_2033 [Pseudomonadota bacterium]|jgi:putative membrane protein
MKRALIVVAAMAGIGLTVWLVWLVGYDSLLDSLRLAGLSGLAWLCLASVIPTVLLGVAWRSLVPEEHRVPLREFVLGRMIRDAVADISPLTVVGGMVASIRYMMLRKLLPSYAIASTAVDATTEMLAPVAFIALGVAICVVKLESMPDNATFYEALTAGVLIVLIFAVLALILANGGMKPLKNLALRILPQLKVEASSTWALYEMFGSWRRITVSCAAHLAAWISSGLLIYLAFTLVGAKISLLEALAIEALLCMLRSLVFFVPASIGVQEAGYAMLAPLFGVPPELGLAVSLLRRAREIIAGLPALLVWQWLEGRAFWQRCAPVPMKREALE